MGGVVRFSLAELRPLVEHARAAEKTRPTLAQLTQKDLQLPSARGRNILSLREEDVDQTKVPKQLLLVKDSGCHLMSAGNPGLLVPDQPPGGTRHVVVYGEGFRPEDDYGLLEEVCGGDDFGEGIPLEIFERGLAAGCDHVEFVMSDHSMEIHYSHLPRRRVPATA